MELILYAFTPGFFFIVTLLLLLIIIVGVYFYRKYM